MSTFLPGDTGLDLAGAGASDALEIVHNWSRYALARRLPAADEELWSLRDGNPWYLVAARLPLALRREFSARHGAGEARRWLALLTAAGRCAACLDGIAMDEEAAGGPPSGTPAEARWALAHALKAYRRSAAPPRAAIAAAVSGALLDRWQANGRRCGICGAAVAAGEAIALDHILPVSLGGDDAIDNLRVAHARCNARRGAWQWQGDAAALKIVELRLEPAHPSLCDRFGCWYCGTPTRGYVDVPGLPTLRFCPAHRGWPLVRALLAGHGVPQDALAQAAFSAADGS